MSAPVLPVPDIQLTWIQCTGMVYNVNSLRMFCLCIGKDEVRLQLDSALQDVNTRYTELEETEKRAVCRALIEERGRFCSFVTMLKPVLVSSSSFPHTHICNSVHCNKPVKKQCKVYAM